MDEIRILLVDDHQIITDGLKSLLGGIPGFRVVATASDGKEALEMLKLLTVDLVMMDIDMPVMNGLEATKEIKKLNKPPHVIILSMHADRGMVEELLQTGVDGYLLKNSGREDLTEAITKVMSGSKHFSSEVTLSLSKKSVDSNKKQSGIAEELTRREREILQLIAEGYSNKEIGRKLFISHRTVDTHRTNLMKKLEVTNIAGLVSFAIRNGIVN